MNPAALAAYLELLIRALALAEAANTAVSGIVKDLRRMQAENRDPTNAEWAALNARVDRLRAAL